MNFAKTVMDNGIITGSLIDILSFAAEAAILLWFFSKMPERREALGRRAARTAGFLPLLVLLVCSFRADLVPLL